MGTPSPGTCLPAPAEVTPLGRRGCRLVSEAEAVVRVARMTAKRRTPAERRAAAEALARDLADAPLEAVKRHLQPREWEIAGLHLGGWSYAQIAAELGYSQAAWVRKVVQRPTVQRFIELVRQHQLERILSGTFGVAAQARAAAPKVFEHVVELAGAKTQADGSRVGRAHRDADTLRAASLVLGVSGDLVERRTDLHVHAWLEQLSDSELETYAASGVVPARFQGVAGLLTGEMVPIPCSPLPASADHGLHAGPVPARPEPVLAGGGRGRAARALRARGRRGTGGHAC
jgi:hypothetical protein